MHGVAVEVRSYRAADGSTTWIADRFTTDDRAFSLYLAERAIIEVR